MKYLALFVLVAALDPVRISVSATTMLAGSELNVVCYVRPEKANEWLQIGVENDSVSLFALDGDNAPIPWFRSYGHINCDAGYAYCAIGFWQGEKQIITAVSKVALVIGGCGRDER